MPTIPEVRERLAEIAAKMRASSDVDIVFLASDIDLAIRDLYRRVAFRVAPTKIPPLTDQQKADIRAFAKANPRASQLEIANHFKTNPGRISETLRGKKR